MKHRNQKNAEFHVELDFLLKEASTFCFLSLCPTPSLKDDFKPLRNFLLTKLDLAFLFAFGVSACQRL